VARTGSQSTRPGSGLTVLRKGAVVKGKVLKTLAPGSVLIRISGQTVAARTHVALKPGMKIVLGVQQNKGPVVLQVLGNSQAQSFLPNLAVVFSAIGDNFWKTLSEHLDQATANRNDLACLKKLMDKLIHQSWRKPTPDMVKKLIDRSGLLWEAKLRHLIQGNRQGKAHLPSLLENDLKGALSKCMSDPKEKTAAIINRLFLALEQMQLLNHKGHLEDGRLFLPLPIQMPDGKTTIAQLMIHPNPENTSKKPGRSGSGFHLLLVLEFTALGPFRVDLSFQNNRIRAVFVVSRDSARQAVQNEMPSLSERLVNRGFSFEYAGCLLRDAESVSQSPLMDTVETVGAHFDCQI